MSAFDTAVEDANKLKAKPTNDELLQVRLFGILDLLHYHIA